MHARLTHAGTTVDDQVAFLWTLGHLVQATTAHDDTEFVEKVTAWVLAFLSMEPASSSDDSVLSFQVASASVCLDLIILAGGGGPWSSVQWSCSQEFLLLVYILTQNA
ncbi:hypothetical protein PsorP6_002459 [Peronosclerospora sorghi]|uniref:Uncharacterized protein n=1 Tax=Peronosclerospora sorghi TaxID=230839 RepID=A0ACC0WW96_9STRA|nr:hypothetical protein PsorP6_002459 [Peronosclerospora sorghi]